MKLNLVFPTIEKVNTYRSSVNCQSAMLPTNHNDLYLCVKTNEYGYRKLCDVFEGNNEQPYFVSCDEEYVFFIERWKLGYFALDCLDEGMPHTWAYDNLHPGYPKAFADFVFDDSSEFRNEVDVDYLNNERDCILSIRKEHIYQHLDNIEYVICSIEQLCRMDPKWFSLVNLCVIKVISMPTLKETLYNLTEQRIAIFNIYVSRTLPIASSCIPPILLYHEQYETDFAQWSDIVKQQYDLANTMTENTYHDSYILPSTHVTEDSFVVNLSMLMHYVQVLSQSFDIYALSMSMDLLHILKQYAFNSTINDFCNKYEPLIINQSKRIDKFRAMHNVVAKRYNDEV